MLFDIAGRVALVTGSSRGIGHALAAGLLDAGCTVIINGRDAGRLEQVREAFASDRVTAVAFDATDPAAVAEGVAIVEDAAGPIDILVNNAGMQHCAPLTEFADADRYRLLDTNLSSAFLVGREVARRMVPRGHGKIINICSVQSEAARAGTAAYSATKGALKMLTKGMCADLAG
jgi:gluconate 5-dehydrogenase